jgi:hypothetical protein
MQTKAGREGLASTSEQGATPTPAISRFLKYEPEKSCAVFVQMTELAVNNWFTTAVAL